MRKLFILFTFLSVSLMGFSIDWSGYSWLGNGGVDGKYTDKIKATVSPDLGTGFINNLQTKGTNAAIHIAMPSADFGTISLDAADYTLDGAGFFPHLSAFTAQETTFTVVCGGTTYTFNVYYADGTQAIDWSGYSWLGNGGVDSKYTDKIKATVSPDLGTGFINNLQTKGTNAAIHIAMPSADFGAISLDAADYTLDGAGFFPHLSAFTAQETTFTVVCGGTTYTFNVYYADGTTGGSTPAVTGICASGTYNSKTEGYAIHAQVTKGCNKYYLTLTSATEGKTLTGLVGDNMFCYRYSDVERTHVNGYHMAVAGRYSIAEGAITFTIPSVGDPQMYTPLNVRFSDNQACEISGLQGVRLEPCSSESAATCPDPEPTIINDVNFALQSQGSIAYASSGDPWAAIDGNNGTRWESAFSDPQTLTVDLGQRRIFNAIQIRWQIACAKAFTIEISNDELSWTQIAEETNYTNGGEEGVEYQIDLAEDKTARYIRFNGTERTTGYGYSFWEFRVIRATTPVLTTYTASIPSPFCTIGSDYQVTVTAKDQLNNDFPVETTFEVTPASAGTITSAGVYTPAIAGSATITATGGGKESSIVVRNEISANLALNMPATAGYSASEAFSAAKANNSNNMGDRWGSEGATHPDQDWWYVDLGAKYDISEIAINWQTARPNDYDIRVSDDAATWTNIGVFDTYPAENAYEYYTSLSAIPGRYVGVWARDGYADLLYGISIWDFQVFGTENVSANKFVSATASPAAGGNVTVQAGGIDVTEVPNNTEVTFTATPNEGYDFVNWTNGGVEVSTSATYVVNITASTSLVANFEVKRTAYCATPVSEGSLYLTITNPSSNTYKILLEGSESCKLESAYNNFNFALTHINGENGTTSLPAANWTVDNTGFGSAYVTFTATDFRAITFVSRYVVFNKQGGGLKEFNGFPDANLIKWDATCVDEEAPVLAAPVATPMSGTSVRLALSATDDMAALLTYNVNYKPEGDAGAGIDINFPGTAGATTYRNIGDLTPGTRYQFSVTVSDGIHTSAAQICYATLSARPTAPVPTIEARFVRSVYSDAYESALAHDFIKNNWAWPTYTEDIINGDHMLVYTSNPAEQAQMPDVAWGTNNDGDDAIIAKDGYNDGTNKGLDVRTMGYIHFDIWSAIATNYPEVYLNDTKVHGFALNGSGWQSFDISLSSLTDEQKSNVRFIKFIAFRTPNPEEIVIDNVFFYECEDINFPDDADNSATITANDDKLANVTLNRDILANGEWFTLCLPFDMSAQKVKDVFGNSTIAEMTSSEDRGSLIHLNFDYVQAIEAGKPYLIKVSKDFHAGNVIPNVVIKDVAPIELESTYMKFKGTYKEITLSSENQRFVGPENYLYSPADGGTTMGAFRCYFTIPASSPAPGKRARIVFGEQTATGIGDVQSDNVQSTKVLRDGQLLIIRDGRTYNAQGMLVK